MENKIEDIIRKNFQKREIIPSEGAFESLRIRLNAQAKKKRKKRVLFFVYAASIVGVIFSFQLLFQNKKIDVDSQIITNVKIEDSIPVAPIKDVEVTLKDKIEDKQDDELNLEESDIVSEEIAQTISQERSSIIDTHKVDAEELQSIDSIDQNQMVLTDTFTIKDITDVELDALLASARLSLSQKKSDSIIINAKSMLYEIEVEINKPLPEKVYLTLKTGATTLKELVAPENKNNN